MVRLTGLLRTLVFVLLRTRYLDSTSYVRPTRACRAYVLFVPYVRTARMPRNRMSQKE